MKLPKKTKKRIRSIKIKEMQLIERRIQKLNELHRKDLISGKAERVSEKKTRLKEDIKTFIRQTGITEETKVKIGESVIQGEGKKEENFFPEVEAKSFKVKASPPQTENFKALKEVYDKEEADKRRKKVQD